MLDEHLLVKMDRLNMLEVIVLQREIIEVQADRVRLLEEAAELRTHAIAQLEEMVSLLKAQRS